MTMVASLSTVGSISASDKPAAGERAPDRAAATAPHCPAPSSVLTISPMARLFAVLRHGDFRLLWLAGLASVLGDRIVTVALALFVIDLTGDPIDLGFVLAAHAIPLVAFMLLGGIWADRVPRHRLMVVTDLIRFALHGTLAVLIITGDVAIWQVVVIEALFGSAEAFFRPASTAVIPQTVPEAEIQEANALVAMSNNVCEFVGPALATALVLGVGAGEAFAVDAATFLISAALLVRMSPRRREAAAGADLAGGEEPESLRAQLRGRLRGGARTRLGMGDADRGLRDALLRPRPVVRPRPGGRRRELRRHGRLRDRRRPRWERERSSARSPGSAGVPCTRCGSG